MPMIGWPGKPGTNGTNGTNGPAGAGAVPIARVAAGADNQPAFNPAAVVAGWTERTDYGGQFNAATGVFTAATAGWYTVLTMLAVNDGQQSGLPGFAAIRKNGTVVAKSPEIYSDSVTCIWSGELAAGDTIDIWCQTGSAAVALPNQLDKNQLSITGIAI